MSGSLRKRLDAMRNETLEASQRSRDSMARHETSLDREWRDRELMRLLRPAAPLDYAQWLTGYMGNGGQPTHYYDYPIARASFYVAIRHFSLEHPLFGANAVNIIIPEGVAFLGGDLGHCNLYYMDGYAVRGGWKPVYSDVHTLIDKSV